MIDQGDLPDPRPIINSFMITSTFIITIINFIRFHLNSIIKFAVTIIKNQFIIRKTIFHY